MSALLLLSLPSTLQASRNVAVFVFADAGTQPDGFIDVPTQPVMDSVNDIRNSIQIALGLKNVRTKEEATITLRVVGREERDGRYVVNVHATFKDHGFDLTGASGHQWKHSADEIVERLKAWIRANQARLTN